jgi:Predicted signal-transduction protein containing cAMP-binding and CBS domains
MKVAGVLRTKGRDVHTIHPAATVADAADRLSDSGVGALVVTVAGGGMVGIVSERDLVRGLHDHGAAVLGMTVADVMSRQVRSCTSQDSVTDLMRRMTAERHRHMPVVDGGKLTGLVSIGDVVKHRIEEVELERAVLRDAYISRR